MAGVAVMTVNIDQADTSADAERRKESRNIQGGCGRGSHGKPEDMIVCRYAAETIAPMGELLPSYSLVLSLSLALFCA